MVNPRCLHYCYVALWSSLVAAFLLILHSATKLVQLDKSIRDASIIEKLHSNIRFESSSGNVNDARINQSMHSTGELILCDEECIRFRMFLSQWSSSKPKAAIYYLAQAERFSMLSASLLSVYRYYLKVFNYPIIIFHESGFGISQRKLLRTQASNYHLFFQQVTFKVPHFINSSAVIFNISCLSHISYRHMCRFQARNVYQEPILVGLEYVWRLDDDSELLNVVQFDVFSFMRDRGLHYGYIKVHQDAVACTTGLWKAAEHFIRRKRLKPTFFNDWPDPMMYYNNFEVSALSLWLSHEYVDFINYIDRLGGIYYHRWGDAPIKSIAVSMFVPRNKTYRFVNIAYRHGNFYVNGSYSSF
jgi:alpha 1,2-mannosyltransferase